MIDKHDGLEPVNPGEILGRWAGCETGMGSLGCRILEEDY